jgi:hypothetical protein
MYIFKPCSKAIKESKYMLCSWDKNLECGGVETDTYKTNKERRYLTFAIALIVEL